MSDVKAVEKFLQRYRDLKHEISKVIVGQDAVIEEILISIFSGGHALLIGVPGLAKTLM
jgi:MoxR-like ATPase